MGGANLPAEHRIVIAVALAVAAATARSFVPALAVLGVGLLLTALEHPPVGPLFKALSRLNLFFLFLFCTLPLGFGTPAGPALAFGPVHFTQAGAEAALIMLIKANAVALVFIAMPGRRDARENCRALRVLGIPEKLVTLLLLMGGNIRLFVRELEALRAAATLRGFVPSCSVHTVRTSAGLAAMLFIRAYDKSRRVDDAMRLRGFNGRFVLYAERTPATPAALVLTCACVLIALAIPATGLYFGAP